jgi:hypothetical protein
MADWTVVGTSWKRDVTEDGACTGAADEGSKKAPRASSLFGRKSSSAGRKSTMGKASRRGSVFDNSTTMHGYLEKMSSGALKRWQSRYFELGGHCKSHR